jgi:hypothetical protein
METFNTCLPPLARPLTKLFTIHYLEASKSALQNHARENGYWISIMSSRELRAAYGCVKGGKYRDTRNPETYESKRSKNTASMKTDCRWSAHAKKCDDGWIIAVQNNNHNHGQIVASSALPQHRIAALQLDERAVVRDMSALGHSPTQILNAIRQSNPESNLIRRRRFGRECT